MYVCVYISIRNNIKTKKASDLEGDDLGDGAVIYQPREKSFCLTSKTHIDTIALIITASPADLLLTNLIV